MKIGDRVIVTPPGCEKPNGCVSFPREKGCKGEAGKIVYVGSSVEVSLDNKSNGYNCYYYIEDLVYDNNKELI